MTDPANNDPSVNQEEFEELQPSLWPKRLKVSAGLLLVLLLVGYFFIGSSFFVRSFVLPAVEKSMMAKIQVEDISLSPFSQVELKDLAFIPNDGETLVSAERALVRYSLFSILGGTIQLNQLQLIQPQVTIIESADGTSNLSSWLDSLPPSPNEPLPILDLNDLSIDNGVVILRKQMADGGQNQMELALNKFTLDRIGQDLNGSLNLDAVIKMLQTNVNGDATSLTLKLALDGALGLNSELLPKNSAVKGQLGVQSATGAYADMMGVTGILNLAIEPGNIENVSLSIARNGQAAGKIQVKGPLDFANFEGRIVASFENLNRQFLNLAGAVAGIDFKDSVLDGSLIVTTTNGGNLVALDAKAKGSNVSLGLGDKVTPPLNMELDTVLNYNADDQKLVIQQLGVSVVDGSTPSITGNLAQPITFAWGGQSGSFQEPEFNLNVVKFDIGKWHQFTANTLSSGELFGDLNFKVQQFGARMQAAFTGGLKDTDVQWDGHDEKGTSASLALNLMVEDFSRFTLNRTEVGWNNASGDSLVTVSSSGSYSLGGSGYSIQSEVKANLALLKPFLSIEGLVIEQGTCEFSLRLQSRSNEMSGVIGAALKGYTGAFSGMPFNRYTVRLSSECSIREQLFKLGSTKVEFQEDFNDGGSLGVRGDLDLENLKGSFTVQSTSINRYALSPFLSPYVNPKDLAEVALNMQAKLELDPAAESSFEGNTSLSNLQVKDPETGSMKSLESSLDLDIAWNAQKLDIRSGTLKLTPTSRAGNTLKISGQLPMVPSLASKGNLKIESPSMDLASYYDMIVGNGEKETESNADTQAVSQPQPAPKPTALEEPLGVLDLKIDIGKFLVRDLAVEALQAHAIWQTNTVVIQPLSMTINKGTVKGDLTMDFTQPNWGYHLSFEADQVPLQAFTDTLDPSKKGQVSGMLSGKGVWKGAGLTEPALQQNLNGSMSFKYSDAKIELVSPKVRLLMTPITALLRLPELLNAPITGMEANLKVERQNLGLTKFKVLSNAFQVHAAGNIPLDNVLTNSVLNLPVEFHLERSIASKSSLIPFSAPKDTPFVKLPDFVKLEGTIGAPKTKTDKLVLSGLLMKSAAGLPLNVGEGAVNVLKDVGSFLTGDSKKTNSEGNAGESATDEGAKPSGGVLNQVNPLKLFNQFRKRSDNEDEKKTPEE